MLLPILAVLAATAATWPAQLKVAQPGDVLVLSGDFPAVLSVSARDGLSLDATAASLAGLRVTNSSNITVKGGIWRPTSWSGAIYAIGSRAVKVQGVSVEGMGLSPGVTFRDSSDGALTGSRVDRASVGVNILRADGVLVSGNALIGSASDGIDIASSHHVTVEANGIMGNRLVDDHHPDAIQMWSIIGEVPTSDVTIRANLVHGPTQGINLFDHGAGGGDRIVIEGNTLDITYPQAIAINAVRASAVRNNTVRTLPGAAYHPTINVSGDLVRCGNVVGPGAGKPGVIDAACK